jgi:hypothetical protein
MQEEGVIKFDLRYTCTKPVDLAPYAQLNDWRSVLWERALIGQDPLRYGGYGFGNVSQRTASSPDIDGQRALHWSRLTTRHPIASRHTDPSVRPRNH